LTKEFKAEVELIASSGGVFEVVVDGGLIYSKKKLGRFPEANEVARILADSLPG
jgi:selenoprotein W-related protein